MATIGQILTAPESGWKRIDDTNSNIIYSGATWSSYSSASLYGGNYHYSSATNGAYIKFKFYGTKFRIISAAASSKTANVTVTIDGISSGSLTQFSSPTEVYQILQYEKTGLTLGNHVVIITSNEAKEFTLDAIDIDDVGYLSYLLLNQVDNINKLTNIGDCIPCRYTAPVYGSVGTFSELGTCTASPIPATSSATPDGSFNWIFSGYDYKGRMKLIADRNLQHSISWDTLNTAGIANDEGIFIETYNYYKASIRLLTGGVSATDKDNEWDRIIANSTLNGAIVPGDNNIWNWSGIYTMSSTVSTFSNATRTLRGNATVATGVYNNGIQSASTFGFRPMMLIEQLKFFKFLIQDGTNIAKTSDGKTLLNIGSAPVTQEMFDTQGMNDLTLVTPEVINMISSPKFKIILNTNK